MTIKREELEVGKKYVDFSHSICTVVFIGNNVVVFTPYDNDVELVYPLDYVLSSWVKIKYEKRIDGWINIYPEDKYDLYSTKELADKYAGTKRIGCYKFNGTYEVEE